ncbi:MAG: beta-galactosidase, partial [Chloroflexi bacterium]|nr:beta-galactosidase [Chloroflexota bacterium]
SWIWGGRDPYGNTLGVNSYYLTRNGEPFFVVSGEFHFARCPEQYWEQELLKMQAGGVNTVASYLFWIYHEETPGVFDWHGRKDLRRFVELCGRSGLNVVLRVGPFAHGEWRNGGLPDWLYGQPFLVRSNDPRYLAYVERYYGAVAEQVRGQFFSDGGPIIGIQLENEYMHASAPWEVIPPDRELEWIPKGAEGAAHLVQLKKLALSAGLAAPFYFVTAWGGAPIVEDETLPVYAEYAYPTWVDSPAPSGAYVFRDRHALPVEQPTHRVPDAYPFILAEQQGGIQITYRNRPTVPPRSTEAMALVLIGDGSNALGYYMYHGGTTPRNSHSFSHERLHPELSYDFQAPIGEYGQVRDSYRYLKLLHLFLQSYGTALAPMRTFLPDGAAAIAPTDTTTPRYCVRAEAGSGFLFVNNFQDHVEMGDLEQVSFELQTAEGTIALPQSTRLTVKKNACFILPFNQSLHGTRLIYATAQPLTLVHAADYTHYFYFAPEGIQPEFCFDSGSLRDVRGEVERSETANGRTLVWPKLGRQYSFTLVAGDDTRVIVTTLTRSEAEHAWKGTAWGAERVVHCEADVAFDRGALVVSALDKTNVDLTVFPPVDVPVGAETARVNAEPRASCTHLHVSMPAQEVHLQIVESGRGRYLVRLPAGAWRGGGDLFLTIDYEGDTGMAFVDGRLVADNFCNGLPWVIGLARLAPDLSGQELCLVFRPLRQGTLRNISSNLSADYEFEGTEKLSVRSLTARPQYSARLTAQE